MNLSLWFFFGSVFCISWLSCDGRFLDWMHANLKKTAGHTMTPRFRGTSDQVLLLCATSTNFGSPAPSRQERQDIKLQSRNSISTFNLFLQAYLPCAHWIESRLWCNLTHQCLPQIRHWLSVIWGKPPSNIMSGS